jgi:beta-lactamase class A
MRHPLSCASLLLLLLLPPQPWPAEAQDANWALARRKTELRLQEIAGSVKGAMGLVALDLTSGERFAVNEDLVFPQGSAIKIPVMMEVFKQAAAGRFALGDRRAVAAKTGGSGVLKELGDGTSELAISDLVVLMILVSDNTATNMLIDLVGMEEVNRTLGSLGLRATRLNRRMITPEASSRGEENLSTPAEAARVMELLHRGEFLSRKACEDMLAILRKPKPGSIRSGLPAGSEIAVAFKPGGIPGVSTEWAIVYLEARPYVLVVMENLAMEDEAAEAMRQISRTAYDYFWRRARSTPYGTYVEPRLLARPRR